MPPKSRAAGVRKPRRKDKKNVAAGQAHIKSTFNNTIVSITDPAGAVISWLRPARSASRARASRRRSPRRWRRNRLPVAPKSTACARSTCSSKARDRAAKRRSGRCRPPVSRLAPFKTSPRPRTMAAGRRSAVASKALRHHKSSTPGRVDRRSARDISENGVMRFSPCEASYGGCSLKGNPRAHCTASHAN